MSTKSDRTAIIHLKDDTFLNIPEDMWPQDIQDKNDWDATEHWCDITGLHVAMKMKNLRVGPSS